MSIIADTITTVMTVQQITEKLQKKVATEGERMQFATIVRASITEMNVDALLKNIISIKWCAHSFPPFQFFFFAFIIWDDKKQKLIYIIIITHLLFGFSALCVKEMSRTCKILA